MGDRAGLIVDWGGVLTTDVFAGFRAFCAAEGLAPGAVRERFASDPRGYELLCELECGRLSEAGFEAGFAELLGVTPTGLIDRLFAGMRPDVTMVEAVRAARAAGIPTALLSNSWGQDRYDSTMLAELFDAVVISGEVGMRKPDPAIYPLAPARLGLEPEACVYVDDLPGNLKPARALGMATIAHRAAATTLAELEALLGVPLSRASRARRGT